MKLSPGLRQIHPATLHRWYFGFPLEFIAIPPMLCFVNKTFVDFGLNK
ncbi:hypothetical protein [Celerinatantimonas sp. YJH-8]